MHALAAVAAAVVLAGGSGWERAAPMPQARSEVAAAVLAGEIIVAGGFLADGSSSARVDAYAPANDRWRRLPDLPVAANHAMAAAGDGRLYVVGGFAEGRVLRGAFVLDGSRWRRLPPLPEGRGAGGAAVVGGKLYVVGGRSPGGLGRTAFVLDLRTRRWSRVPAPTPREHLGVAVLGGRIYAVAGRTAGFDTNVAVAEVWSPGQARWRRLPPVPEARGGTGLAALPGLLVSVGGEETQGTIRSVYAYDVAARRWRRLPDLPTPRHGLAVAAVGGRVYAIAGGEQPGLFVSAVNEWIAPRQRSGS